MKTMKVEFYFPEDPITGYGVNDETHADAKPVLAAVPLDGDGQRLNDGDRVYSYGYNKDMKPERLYGTIYKNEYYPEVSEWYIAYDDGEECAVLELSLVFKA